MNNLYSIRTANQHIELVFLSSRRISPECLFTKKTLFVNKSPK